MDKKNKPVVSGQYHTLKVKDHVTENEEPFFLLSLPDGKAAPLHASEAPAGLKTGDEVEIFLFLDGRNGLKATTQKPCAVLGEFAAMEVLAVTEFGIFLDWGIRRDLFVPSRMLRTRLNAGDIAVVYLITDLDGIGIIGTSKFEDYFDEETSELEVNQEMECLVAHFSELGIKVILDKRYKGLLYWNEVFDELNIGDNRKAYIKKIRPDGLIDASLTLQGFKEASRNTREIILATLEKSDGFLPLTDKSHPEDIKSSLKMSKKIFKKTVGSLYRSKKIQIEDNGIRLN